MPSTLYDIFWLNPLPAESRRVPVSLNKRNTLAKPDIGLPAVILFPALLTPEIVAGEKDVINLILAFTEKDLDDLKSRKAGLEMSLKIAINKHVKVFEGLNTDREYAIEPLFADADWAAKIKLKSLGKLNTGKFESIDGGFAGIFHKEAVKMYKENELVFDQVYAVSLDARALKALPAKGTRHCRNTPLAFEDGIGIRPEKPYNQDYILNQSKAIKSDKLKEKGRYGFKVKSADVEAGVIDFKNPIQAFHPVFYFEQLDYADLAHISDLHVNSRQQVLRHSKAKVIEDSAFKSVGEMINVASKDTLDLLTEFASDKDVDVLVIGGDLVDFMKNVCVDGGINGSPKISEIWELVDMEKRKLYKDYTDFIAFYSMIVAFYKKPTPKPAYVVTGNHDCYYEPYGISPRVPVKGKANEGIPWDHNLTIYEAILSFGKSYGKVLTGLWTSLSDWRPPSSFKKEKLAWFYNVLTPFSDFTIQLPNQRLVGLGWGNSEEMISFNRLGGQTGKWYVLSGHLPRAEDAISDKQYKFLKSTAIDKEDNKKIVLTTHFTFVSYHEGISNAKAASSKWGNSHDQGDVYYEDSVFSTKHFSKADMGTFELRRKDLYKKIIERDRRIQIILTGHSHRRGFYTVRRDDTDWNNSVKTGFHDFPVFKNGEPHHYLDHEGNDQPLMKQDKKPPWIILSDSGGSVPRMNLNGEFKGWGSDLPSGTKIKFNNALGGKVDYIEPVRVKSRTAKPRFVVALDYLDIMEDAVIDRFTTGTFKSIDTRSFKNPWQYKFDFRWSKLIKESLYKLRIRKLKLYMRQSGGKLEEYTISYLADSNKKSGKYRKRWVMDKETSVKFRKRMRADTTRESFLAIWFSSDKKYFSRYDFSTPWTFEVKVEYNSEGEKEEQKEELKLVRQEKNREIPSFKQRRKHYPWY